MFFFEVNVLDPIPLVDSLNVLKSKCSILKMKILREIQNLDTKSFILKIYFCIVITLGVVENEIEYEPKHKSVSKECIGNS